MKKEYVHRFIWLFMAGLFIVTALGVGVYAFWINTHNGGASNPASNYISCSVKPVNATQTKKNGKLEGAKLAGFTPTKHVSYLQCQDLKVGTGATVTPTSTITADYTGAVASTGTIFQSSLDSGQPFTTSISSGVIQGWVAGVPGMKAGGVRRLIIPAQYAYGSQSVAGIPPNSDLVFDISVIATK
jgi:FKBP-type peptidyl-prolyl cis-trans isomerase FkpA